MLSDRGFYLASVASLSGESFSSPAVCRVCSLAQFVCKGGQLNIQHRQSISNIPQALGWGSQTRVTRRITVVRAGPGSSGTPCRARYCTNLSSALIKASGGRHRRAYSASNYTVFCACFARTEILPFILMLPASLGGHALTHRVGHRKA